MALFGSSGSGLKEGIQGLGCGLVFGVTSPLIGHPFDTIKTKMQAEPAFMNKGMIASFRTVVQTQGVRGLYRGLLPPLLGSSIFRSVQFAVYGACYGTMEDTWASKPMPYTGGLQPRIVLSGMTASLVRCGLETPLEFIKVRRQTGQTWRTPGSFFSLAQLRALFTGFGVSYMRTAGLMTTFFVMVDTTLRHAPEIIEKPLVGPFIKGGVFATTAWWLIWPFETLKNQVQSNTGGKDMSMAKRMRSVLAEKGVRGLYRGILPGSSRSLLANGVSMIAFTACQANARPVLDKFIPDAPKPALAGIVPDDALPVVDSVSGADEEK